MQPTWRQKIQSYLFVIVVVIAGGGGGMTYMQFQAKYLILILHYLVYISYFSSIVTKTLTLESDFGTKQYKAIIHRSNL